MTKKINKDLKDKKVIIPKGEIVTCPGCGIEIAEVIEDIYAYERIRAECFRGISQEIIPKEKTLCKKCGEEWGRLYNKSHGEIHLKYGWNTPKPNSIKFIQSL